MHSVKKEREDGVSGREEREIERKRRDGWIVGEGDRKGVMSG